MNYFFGCLSGCFLIAMLASCGVNSDLSEVTKDLVVGNTSCLVMDLDTGTVKAYPSLEAALALSGIRDNLLVLVRVPGGAVVGGSAPSMRWALADEVVGSKGSEQTFVSVFEITRGQWRRMAATQPWTTMPVGLVGSGDTLPACGFSMELAHAGLLTANVRLPGSFALPTASQWEYLARGGSSGSFPWGDSHDPTVAGLYAVTADSGSGSALTGPRPVGALAANSFGLYDTAGNVWELASDSTIHGGSWLDGLPMARSANGIDLPPTSAHALLGLRLLYRSDQP